jgi:hypothetical protein
VSFVFTFIRLRPFHKFIQQDTLYSRAALRSHTSLDTSSIVAFMKSEGLVAYLAKIVKVGYKKSSSNWFARQEIHFLRIVFEINHQVRLFSSS